MRRLWNLFKWLWHAQAEVESLGRSVVALKETNEALVGQLLDANNRLYLLEQGAYGKQIEDLRRIVTQRESEKKPLPIRANNWRQARQLVDEGDLENVNARNA